MIHVCAVELPICNGLCVMLGGFLQIPLPEAVGFDRQSVVFVPNVRAGSALQKKRKADVNEKHAKRIANVDKKHWDHDKCCCMRSRDLHDGRACHEEYSDALVYRLRLYFENLSESNQRVFYLERFRSTIDLDDIPDDVDLTRKCKGELWVEKPAVLAKRLTNHSSGNNPDNPNNPNKITLITLITLYVITLT